MALEAEGREGGIARLERLESGIPGLDEILGGGFFKGGVYIIEGDPGTGKTIFGNHLCFNHARAGGRALYVTLLAESHDRMLSYMRDMAFFDDALVSRAIFYQSAFATAEEGGLHGLLTLARREVIAREVSLLVIDGLMTLGPTAAATETITKKFIHSLQVQAAAIGCTVFILRSDGQRATTAERTMVDGTIELNDAYQGWVARRDLTATKFRGSGHLRGRHAFKITGEGIRVYPRLEASLREATPAAPGPARRRLRTGIAGLDAMLGGGLPEASSTLVLGPTGSGKTNLALNFLGEATPAEPGMLYGFYETPDLLVARAAAGLAPTLPRLVAEGTVGLFWDAATERLLDEVGHEILGLVRARGVRRLAIDGVAGFGRLAAPPDRPTRFFTALMNELRALGVTSLITHEVPELMGPVLRAPQSDLTVLADNLVLMRFAEADGRLARLVSIVKVRDGAFDATTRPFELRHDGLRLLDEVRPLNPDPRNPEGAADAP